MSGGNDHHLALQPMDEMEQIADSLLRIAPSPTVALTAQVADLKADGREIIALGAGEPDFDTPDHIKEAAIKAIQDGKTRYTAPDGVMELKTAIVEKFRRDNRISVETNQVSVGSGGKQVLFNALVSTLNPGDEVVIAAPYWVSYPDIVRFAGGTPVVVPTTKQNAFLLTPEDLEKAITVRTRWVILNSPNNPTGSAYPRAALSALLDIVDRHPNLMVLADDIYEHITYDGFEFSTPAELRPDLADRILTLNGVSKSYAMTGWRIGFAVGPIWLINAMRKLQSQSTTNPCSISQWAAHAALTGPQDGLVRQSALFEQRRDAVLDDLGTIEGMDCTVPAGAFYVFPDISIYTGRIHADYGKISSDQDFAAALLALKGVALVPGSAFGTPDHIRISYAASTDDLSEACRRLKIFCQELS